MLLFQITLSQRDSVLSLFNRLNALIFQDDRPQKETDDCTLAINRLIITLNNLAPAHEASSNGTFHSSSESRPANASSTRPLKKARTEGKRDEITFEIHLDKLLNIILQIMKNQKAAIEYSNLVPRPDKIQLFLENNSQIGELLGLSTRRDDESSSVANEKKDAVDGGSIGDHPSGRFGKQRSLADELKSIDFEINHLSSSLFNRKDARPATSSAETTSSTKMTNEYANWIKHKRIEVASDFENQSDASKSSTSNSSNDSGCAANLTGSSSMETNARSSNVPVDILNLSASGRSSAASPSASRMPATSNANQSVVPMNHATVNCCIEDVQRFFSENQESNHEILLSNGASDAKFFLKFWTRIHQPSRPGHKYLAVSLSCGIGNPAANVSVKAILLNQVYKGMDKRRSAYFRFDRLNRRYGFPSFIAYRDLNNSVYLKNNRLLLQFSCQLK